MSKTSRDPSSDSGKDDTFDWKQDETNDESSWGKRPFQAKAAVKAAGLDGEALSEEEKEKEEGDEEDEEEDEDGEEEDEGEDGEDEMEEDEEDDDEEDDDEVFCSHWAGVGKELFHNTPGEAYVSTACLPPTIPGYSELPQPSSEDEDAEDQKTEQRLHALLRDVHWCPALRSRHVPGDMSPPAQGLRRAGERTSAWEETQSTCFAFKNPVCPWLRPDVVDPKGWMVYEAQLKDLFHFNQWQERVRGPEPGDAAAPLPELLAAWDDPVLPPEYYDTFPDNYLRSGVRRFMCIGQAASRDGILGRTLGRSSTTRASGPHSSSTSCTSPTDSTCWRASSVGHKLRPTGPLQRSWRQAS